MNNKAKELWLFNYNNGINYERFSRCEDTSQKIFRYLEGKYNLHGLTVMEIGAGSGKFTRFLAKSCGRLYVVERSESLMDINKAKNKNCENISFIVSDIKDLSIPDNTIDVVFGGWSMTSMRDNFPAVIGMITKMLKQNGRIILVENAGEDEFTRLISINKLSMGMRKLYRAIGFTEQAILNTVISLPNAEVFYEAFPHLKDVHLESLRIHHRVLILEATVDELKMG